MIIDDLKKPCTACNTSGRQAGLKNWGGHLANTSGACAECKGRGHTLTKLGIEVWELYRPMFMELVQSMAPQLSSQNKLNAALKSKLSESQFNDRGNED